MMWTAADAKALMLADPSQEEESDLVLKLNELVADRDKERPSLGMWVGVAAGVAGIAALVNKLLSLDIQITLPSLADIKGNLGLGPQEVKAEAGPQAVPTQANLPPQDLSSVEVTAPSQPVMSIIDNAAQVVGIDKALLLAIAHQESRFNPKAKAKTSSATGLFQLVSGTWRDLVKRYGKQYGITIADIKVPEKNAILGACYVRDLVVSLRKSLGKEPSVTDVYAGFFLGASGARTLLDAVRESPKALASTLMPRAAKANKAIFYKGNESKTVAEVYATLYGKVGKQYLKFAQQTNTPVTMAAADTTVLLPSPADTGTSVAYAPTKFAAPPAATQVARTEATPVSFSSLPKQPVQVALAETTGESDQGGLAVSGNAPKKQPQDYYRTRSGNVLALTG